ncbi:hypothetical protein AX17_005602 [Amanita inopinata Kibby_2008]|nr:hypothetical protein AX17_005602 [Amanita inopinata Kibby_2008]
MAGPSTLRHINGSVPGLLDPTQPERLLRLPGSKLLFAAFDPLTATDVTGPGKHSINEEFCRPKRIVVEIMPNGDSHWRFVPNARREDGVPDEGEWPRPVGICGEVIQCSQEQWDIYKLDPLYDCYVRTHPNIALISRITTPKTTSERLSQKRRASTPLSDMSTPAPSQRKKVFRATDREATREDSDISREDQGEVEEMVVDDQPSYRVPIQQTTVAHKLRKTRKPMDRMGGSARQAGKLASQRETVASTGEMPQSFTSFFPNDFNHFTKRKYPNTPRTSEESEQLRTSARTYASTRNGKRTRTVSPSSTKRELDTKREKREKRKIQRRERLHAKGQERDTHLFESLMQDIPEDGEMGKDSKEKDGGAESDSGSQSLDEDRRRQAAIEESRRKLAQLEADKPLWEAAAKHRLMREKLEEETIRVKIEDLRKARDEFQHEARSQRETEEKKKKEEEERRRKEESAQWERERRQRQQQRWAFGPWTVHRALERYKVLSEDFDTTKFNTELPLTIEAVPWPVLVPPTRFDIADVDWGAVEKFFNAVRDLMKPHDYRSFVERSHRRFHPDRWRSRSILKTVLDEAQRDYMEIAANTVAQALTPIWRELTGR